MLRRNPDLRRVPIEASEIGGLSECITAQGDLRTLPSTFPPIRRANPASTGSSPHGSSAGREGAPQLTIRSRPSQ